MTLMIGQKRPVLEMFANAGLSTGEVHLLGWWISDRMSAAKIGAMVGMPRQTILHLAHAAVAKLRKIGVMVELPPPRRSRRIEAGPFARSRPFDPAAIGEFVLDQSSTMPRCVDSAKRGGGVPDEKEDIESYDFRSAEKAVKQRRKDQRDGIWSEYQWSKKIEAAKGERYARQGK